MSNSWAYFDYAAATPVDPVILDGYFQDMQHYYANAGGLYELGRQSARLFEQARAKFADVIHADAREIIFTSGATESDNLALLGACGYHGAKSPRVITLETEHKAILDPLAKLARNGVKIDVLPVKPSGLIDLDLLKKALETPATLVSVMAVNNETGVIQPIKEITEIVHQAGAKFHVDAAQALGKITINVAELGVDMMSFSGHKIYAPKGVGALYLKRFPKMRIQAQIMGGGQQCGQRSGTIAVALINAFVNAAEIACDKFAERGQLVRTNAEKLIQKLPRTMQLNTSFDFQQHVPHILSIDTKKDAAELIAKASDNKIAFAAGSACQSSDNEASHVLKSMGLTAQAKQSIRVSISHLTSDVEIQRLVDFLNGEKNDTSN